MVGRTLGGGPVTRTYEHVGITGSRDGCTNPQRHTLERALARLCRDHGTKVFHHGDCVGVDWQAAAMARSFGLHVIGHPPVNESLRSYFPSDEMREPAGYLERDRALSGEVDLLLGCPKTPWPQHRSGTWFTIKYAEQTGTKVAVILPDGRWRR